MKQIKRTSWMYIAVAGTLLCGYGPCSPSYCPTGSGQGNQSGCWYEFNSTKSSVSVNRGELKVKLQKTTAKPTKKQAPLYRFSFIQDPQERSMGNKHGRVGTWKLQVSPNPEGQKPRPLHLSWKLRDPKPSLRKNETLRLAITWMGPKKRQYKILPGRYDASSHRVSARLPAQALHQNQVYLLPVRHKRQAILTQAPGKTQKPRLTGMTASVLLPKP